MYDQRSISGALTNSKHGLFHIRYFENGPLEPGYVNRGSAIDVLEVINLTNPEEAQNFTKRFFEDQLKMDLTGPCFNN